MRIANLNQKPTAMKKLEKLNACGEAILYVRTQKSVAEAWKNCERGDWMLWIAKKLNVDDRKLTMTKATCVKQVEHLLKDQRSKDALQACFDYATGRISREELNILAENAYAAADVTRINSLKKSADICREYLTEEVLIKYRKLK